MFFFVVFISLPVFFVNCANTYAYIPRAIGAMVTLESSGIELCFGVFLFRGQPMYFRPKF